MKGFSYRDLLLQRLTVLGFLIAVIAEPPPPPDSSFPVPVSVCLSLLHSLATPSQSSRTQAMGDVT